jgi:F-type H+-transporting ATPase subunit b
MLRFNITLLYVWVAFPIAYAILKRYLFTPLAAILDQRQRDEATAARVHAESLEELQKTIVTAERELSRARIEALKQREKLRGEGKAHWERKLAEAAAAARATIDRASNEIDEQAKRTAQELPPRARTLASELASKILGRKLAA